MCFIFFTNTNLNEFLFWSLDQRSFETLGVTTVRTYVRPSRFFSETAHYFFKKWPKKIFRVKNFFTLILPKKHSLITQKRFWPLFGVLSGFLRFPRTSFGGWSLYFDNFLGRKTVGSRETPRDGLFRLVHRNCLIFGTKVNVGNTYTFVILKWFGIILIPSNPP